MICVDFSLFVMSFCRNEIVSLLSVNRRIGADLIADVIDQSADNLVDGVTAGINLHFQDMLWSDIKKKNNFEIVLQKITISTFFPSRIFGQHWFVRCFKEKLLRFDAYHVHFVLLASCL